MSLHIVVYLRNMASKKRVSIGSGNGLFQISQNIFKNCVWNISIALNVA